MDNLYYYTFYILTRFIKWTNPNRVRPNFAAVGMLSAIMFFTVITLLAPLESHPSLYYKDLLINTSLILVLIAFNYFMLMNDGKSEKIINFFDEKYQIKKHSKIKILLFVIYIFTSFAVSLYVISNY